MSRLDIDRIVGLATSRYSLITRAFALTVLSAREPEKFRQVERDVKKKVVIGENNDKDI
jgi:hypothetical protein